MPKKKEEHARRQVGSDLAADGVEEDARRAVEATGWLAAACRRPEPRLRIDDPGLGYVPTATRWLLVRKYRMPSDTAGEAIVISPRAFVARTSNFSPARTTYTSPSSLVK